MDLPLQPDERDVLVQVIDEQLDAAEDVERDLWRTSISDDPDDVMQCVTYHSQRTEKLRRLRKRLEDAA